MRRCSGRVLPSPGCSSSADCAIEPPKANSTELAGGLNLVVAAIVLWNTAYMERAIRHLRGRGEKIPNELMPYLAPLGWQHINLAGDFIWTAPSKLDGEGFRPLAAPSRGKFKIHVKTGHIAAGRPQFPSVTESWPCARVGDRDPRRAGQAVGSPRVQKWFRRWLPIGMRVFNELPERGCRPRRYTFLDASAAPRRAMRGHAPPSICGSRPPTKSPTYNLTGCAPTRFGPVSISSRITAMWACQAAEKAALSSML